MRGDSTDKKLRRSSPSSSPLSCSARISPRYSIPEELRIDPDEPDWDFDNTNYASPDSARSSPDRSSIKTSERSSSLNHASCRSSLSTKNNKSRSPDRSYLKKIHSPLPAKPLLRPRLTPRRSSAAPTPESSNRAGFANLLRFCTATAHVSDQGEPQLLTGVLEGTTLRPVVPTDASFLLAQSQASEEPTKPPTIDRIVSIHKVVKKKDLLEAVERHSQTAVETTTTPPCDASLTPTVDTAKALLQNQNNSTVLGEEMPPQFDEIDRISGSNAALWKTQTDHPSPPPPCESDTYSRSSPLWESPPRPESARGRKPLNHNNTSLGLSPPSIHPRNSLSLYPKKLRKDSASQASPTSVILDDVVVRDDVSSVSTLGDASDDQSRRELEELREELKALRGWMSLTERTNGALAASTTTTTAHPVQPSSEESLPPPSLPKEEVPRRRPRRRVAFSHPLVTKVKHRPKTLPEEVSKLFFAEEELQMLEEDRENRLQEEQVECIATPSAQDPRCVAVAFPSTVWAKPDSNKNRWVKKNNKDVLEV